MASLHINENLSIDDSELQLTAIRAQGSGGQNVNKVSSAIHLRFDIPASSLPDLIKQRLLNSKDSRITQDGIFVIKAQSYRTQEQNKEDALKRLVEWVKENTKTQKLRRPTKPSKASRNRRMDKKKIQGKKKSMRGKVEH